MLAMALWHYAKTPNSRLLPKSRQVMKPTAASLDNKWGGATVIKKPKE